MTIIVNVKMRLEFAMSICFFVMLFATTVCSGQPKKDSTIRGSKQYELTNHLGNVLATVSDRRLKTATPPAGTSGVIADLLSATDYYAFGMLMPGRNYSVGDYRFGFNGKENDNDVIGVGNEQDYGMRIYYPRLGRFLSVDPLTKQYPYLTPYQFASNEPIWKIDIDGLEGGFTAFVTATFNISSKLFNSGIGVQYTLNKNTSLTLNINNYTDNNKLVVSAFANVLGMASAGITTNRYGQTKLFAGSSKQVEITTPTLQFTPATLAPPSAPVTNLAGQQEKNFNDATNNAKKAANTNNTNASTTTGDGKLTIKKSDAQPDPNATSTDPHIEVTKNTPEEVDKVDKDIKKGLAPFKIDQTKKEKSTTSKALPDL